MKKIFLAALFALILATMLMIPVFAKDSRYYSYWYSYYDQTDGPWYSFTTSSTHDWSTYGRFNNRFASIIGEYSGHQHGTLRTRLQDRTSKRGEVTLWLKMYVESESDKVGAKLKVTFNTYNSYMYMQLMRLDGSNPSSVYSVSNYNNYYAVLTIKWGSSYDRVSGKRMSQWYARAGYQHVSTGVYTYMKNDYNTLNPSIASQAYFVHEVYCDWGATFPSQGKANSAFAIVDIGIRPDLANEDCYVNILDLGVVSAEYLKSRSSIGWYNWFWTTACWKADVNCDGVINTLDLSYIASKFGQQY